jgi:O-methyltransferase involved in polyketide biosynthesis
MTTPDTSSISFTAIYTGQVWQRNGLSAPGFDSHQGRLLYRLLAPFEFIGGKITGGNVRTFLLQRHYIIDYLLERAIREKGVNQVLEIACGLSPRGYRFHLEYPDLRYIECDLPAMASRKRKLLTRLGNLDQQHQVTELNIFSREADGIEALIEQHFDTKQPLLVITEGLVNYFPLDTMDVFWQRLRQSLSNFPGAVYLTDNYPLLEDHPFRHTMKVMSGILGAVSRSDANFHFGSDAEAREHFLQLGFNEVEVHDPRDYYMRLPIPRCRNVPLVRVIEANL